MNVRAIQIALVDDRGRTLCKFWKETHLDADMNPTRTDPWNPTGIPMSAKKLAQPFTPTPPARRSATRINRHDNGVYYLEVPGLIRRWHDVQTVLDQVAISLGLLDADGAVLVDNLDAAKVTVAQLR